MNQGRCCICEVVFPSRMSLLERSEHVQNCLSKDHVQISVCWICQVDMAGFTAKGQEEHMEECFARRGCKESAEVYRNQQCPICGLNLLLFPESERLLHAEECLEEGVGSCGKFEDSEFIEESVPKNQTWRELAMPQLSDSKFKCFNCSKDLSKHGIKQRMMHMKKCSNLEESSLELIFNFSQSEQPASSMTASRGNSKNSPQHVVTSIKLALSRIEEQISSLQNAKVSLQRRLDRAQSLLASTSSNAEEMDVPSTPSNHQQSMSDGNELEDKNYVSVTQNFKKSALKERRKKDRSLWSLSERTEEESGNNPQSTNTTDYNDSKELSSCSSKESSGSIKRRCKGQKNDSFLSTSIMPDFSSLSESELKRHMSSVGLKHGSRTYMVKELTNLWSKFCKYRASKSAEESENSSNSQNHHVDELRYDGSMQSSGKILVNSDVERRISEFIRSNDHLYQQILTFQTIEVQDLMQLLKDEGIKCSKPQLINYLNSQSVSYSEKWRKNH